MTTFVVSLALAMSALLPNSGFQATVCTTGACPAGYKMICSGEEGTKVCYCVQPGPINCEIFNCRS
jgi:hypothetical protein